MAGCRRSRDTALFLGALSAYGAPGLLENDNPRWAALATVLIFAAAVALLAFTERELRRCRRFLADSAGW